MLDATRTIILAAIKLDGTITDAEAEAVKRAVDWRETPLDPLEGLSRLVPYPEAARRLGVTARTIKNWIKEGLLDAPKRGRKRAAGVTVESLLRALHSQ